MRTVPTLAASAAGTSLSAIGLVLGRALDDTHANTDMTAVASTYPIPLAQPHRGHPEYPSKRSFSSPLTRLTSWDGHGKTYSSGGTRQKRSWSPGAGTNSDLGMEKPTEHEEGSSSHIGTPNARPTSWLRRFSSMSTSRDSSRTPTSRPGSAAVSNSNHSLALSRTGSTTLMFPDTTPPPVQPNKLVKRNSSMGSTNSSPFSSVGSKLPLPTFRRPATSHQRSVTAQESLSSAGAGDRMSIDHKPVDARDPAWRQYFTPRAARDEFRFGRRPSSSGIPNPIKRVYPDRRYTPVLMSGKEVVRMAEVEFDDGISVDEGNAVEIKPSTQLLDEAANPRRSFSISDLLSTGPSRPTPKSKVPTSKLARRGRTRVTSAPQASMGSSLSSSASNGIERPAKRRDITDPQANHRSIYSSPTTTQPEQTQAHETPIPHASSTPPSQHSPLADSPRAETLTPAVTPSSLEQRRLPSANLESTAARHVRVSATQSVAASTVGSDSEQRSVSGYSTDYQSDAVFDSFPTRTTRSSSGKRGPPIDTIFDDSPPPTFSSGRSTKLHDLLGDGQFPTFDHIGRHRHSTIEEEESVASTPVRSLHDNSVTSTPSARPGAHQLFTSSPPAMSLQADLDEPDWDAPDDLPPTEQGLGIQHAPSTPLRLRDPVKFTPFRFGGFPRPGNVTSVHSTPNRFSNGFADKANVFDWSEQQPSPSHQDQSPPRPRTVHGKKDPADRGSRTTGRRAPSGIHARSHSVPVVPDADGKRSVMANKFGTWGVGSKAVTEDWNEDFDFEEEVPPVPEISDAFLDEKRIDSGHEMFVPKSIREQQESVVANIGLLREWGLLIEELKELRIRAVGLDMLSGPHANAWQEVDAMIELADQESEEATLEPRRSPPSSPGFDFDGFDEEPADVAMPDRSYASSIRDFEFEEGADEPGQLPSIAGSAVQPVVTRPRKDSEAVARSVIAALQSKRSVSDPTALHPPQPAKKVPFDTATLRHIVPYVNGLKRKVKDALRETEGLYSSPHRRSQAHDGPADRRLSDDEPAFVRSMFNERGPDSPTSKRRSRREEALTDNDESDDPWGDEQIDLVSRIEKMNLSALRR
ncbi:hypothetical protein LTR27_007694 [Elasticomyces elasticus]|nr:hypothetical protein LTR27_007694 [Elasticomyces elasticus]